MNQDETDRSSHPHRTSSLSREAVRRRRRTVGVPVAGLAFETAVLALAHRDAPDLGPVVLGRFWLWLALPFALSAVLIWVAAARSRTGWRLATGLGTVLTLAGVAGYVQARTSVTASMIILSGPLVQTGAAVAVGVVVLVICVRRRPRSEV